MEQVQRVIGMIDQFEKAFHRPVSGLKGIATRLAEQQFELNLQEQDATHIVRDGRSVAHTEE